MREELNIFVDPLTGGKLKLKINRKDGHHVISGVLFGGGKKYPIFNGIPRFVDASLYNGMIFKSKETQTIASFGDKWNEGRYKQVGLKMRDYQMLKEQFMAVLGCGTLIQFKNVLRKARRMLNAGCGVSWSDYLFNYNPDTERHCIDMSLSVEAAYKNTKTYENIIVSQASIFKLPYKDATFDIIYSLGVIHHTPDPKKAFNALVKKLAPGGLLGIYIYNKKPFIRETVDEKIRQITSRMSYRHCMDFSKRMSCLGSALKKIKQPIFINRDVELLGIKKGKYNVHEFIYNYFLKCWYNQKQDMKYADLVNLDWYHPQYASHHDKRVVLGWFKNAGLRKIKCIQPKGWEYSGCFISGRMA